MTLPTELWTIEADDSSKTASDYQATSQQVHDKLWIFQANYPIKTRLWDMALTEIELRSKTTHGVSHRWFTNLLVLFVRFWGVPDDAYIESWQIRIFVFYLFYLFTRFKRGSSSAPLAKRQKIHLPHPRSASVAIRNARRAFQEPAVLKEDSKR